MKKILLSVMTLVLVLGLVGAGAFAYFNDTETSTGNILTAGTLDLKIDDDPDGAVFNWVDDPNVPVMNDFTFLLDQINNMEPGGEGVMVIVGIKNAGTIDGTAGIHLLNVVDYEMGRTEPELAVDTTGGNPGAGNGELSQYVDVLISYGDKSVIGDLWAAWVPVASGTLASLAGTYYWTAPMEAGVDDYWVLEFSINSGAGNIIQSDSVKFDIEFSLNQVP